MHLRQILRSYADYYNRVRTSILEQGSAGFSPGSANRCDQFTRHPGRTSSPLRPCLSFRYTQVSGPNMEEFKRLWAESSLAKFESAIHILLPWDVGDSRFLLWASIAAFIIAALIACRIFGLFCGWLARLAIR